MALNEYVVARDNFSLDEGHHDRGLAFPCSCCKHRSGTDRDEPCRSCDHNLNAESADEQLYDFGV